MYYNMIQHLMLCYKLPLCIKGTISIIIIVIIIIVISIIITL